MSLKNVLIIVDNIDESIDFYEELFGLRVITRLEGNVIMSEGLVLQDADACPVVDIVETIQNENSSFVQSHPCGFAFIRIFVYSVLC